MGGRGSCASKCSNATSKISPRRPARNSCKRDVDQLVGFTYRPMTLCSQIVRHGAKAAFDVVSLQVQSVIQVEDNGPVIGSSASLGFLRLYVPKDGVIPTGHGEPFNPFRCLQWATA